MARRVKYEITGARATQPIKNPKEIEKIMYYLLKKLDIARKKNTKIREYQAYRNYMLLLLGFNTAFRAEDLLQLKVLDVKDGYVQIKENKTGKSQLFRINKSIMNEINEYINYFDLSDYDYLYTSQRSDGVIQAITRQQADRILSNIKTDLKIKSRFAMHSLRKTFGYQYYINTHNLLTLQKMYNHSDTATTLLYIMWDKDDVEQARETFKIADVKKAKN